MKKIFLAFTLLTSVALFCACQRKEAKAPAPTAKKLGVITTLFPLYDFARTIGGDKADVTLLLPPGVEAHHFDPKPDEIIKIKKADVFVYTNEYMEPWATKLLKGVATESLLVVDSGKGAKLIEAAPEEEHEGEHGAGGKESAGHKEEGHHHHGGGMDPHIWLDFANARIMVDNIAAGMSSKDPANRDYYAIRAAAYKAELQKLDDEFKAGLTACGTREFIHGGHNAFGYLTRRYGLTYLPAMHSLMADAEPSAADLVALVKQMRKNGLKYIYSEELLSPRTAEAIARETGASVLMLHAAHNISRDDLAKGVNFISLMKKNLESLRTGLQCR
ncbi:MAG TPA: zinc ABC transporter substrate-binding protein [Dongiaceae bacterium]|nr:zinc ABC transporter substrate-binding protein [Dongiaceae bacterium]